MIQDAIKKVMAKENLSKEDMKNIFSLIMSGETTDAQIAGFLIALSLKGETAAEILGAASVMRDKVTKIEVPFKCLDTCGTGGDGSHTINISTAAAIVAAGAGAKVAKHGNKAISSNCGSADVLEKLGVNISITPKKATECIEKVGIGFLFAPGLHKAMKHAIGPRKELGVRTIFNILGPLTNPAGAESQLMGVFDAKLTEVLAEVLKGLGSKHVLVVNGDGLDEISICSETKISELKDNKISTYTITPEQFGIKRVTLDALKGGSSEDNANSINLILAGNKSAHRDAVVINAGAAIYATDMVNTLAEGIKKAEESIDSGSAKKVLEELIKVSNS